MIELTAEELAYYYWKIKKVSYDSLSFSGTDGGYSLPPPDDSPQSFSGTATNFPEEITATSATVETDLVCLQQGNSFIAESTDFSYGDDSNERDFGLEWGAFYYGAFVPNQIFVYQDGDKYYIQPNFSIAFNRDYGDLSYTFSFATESSAPDPGGWYCSNQDEIWCNEWTFGIGEVGTLTLNLGFGTETCPIYGTVTYRGNPFSPPPNNPSASISCSITETETWPYDP